MLFSNHQDTYTTVFNEILARKSSQQSKWSYISGFSWLIQCDGCQIRFSLLSKKSVVCWVINHSNSKKFLMAIAARHSGPRLGNLRRLLSVKFTLDEFGTEWLRKNKLSPRRTIVRYGHFLLIMLAGPFTFKKDIYVSCICFLAKRWMRTKYQCHILTRFIPNVVPSVTIDRI